MELIRLEPMARSDVPQVYSLERLSFTTPWDVASYYTELANPNAYYLVARADSRIVGFGGMWVVGDEAHVVTLAVHPEVRRRGIGRRVMHALVREARRRGARTVTLEVRVGNEAAQQLYCALGFRAIAYRRNYYPDTGEDAAVMALEL
ncbi:MAG: ribosomal protein S18-alanine N-acetyltransferase [Armatimonadota bacterium]